MNAEINEIVKIMCNIYQKDISVFDESFLSSSLNRRLAATNIKSLEKYCDLLSTDPAEADRLDHCLHISFSQFFRQPLAFAFLEKRILPSLINAKPRSGEIRIWSAGCAAGQEAYSVAILLDELIRAEEKEVRYRIFATDISESCLSEARTGIYSPSDIQNVRMKYINNYFSCRGESYQIASRLKDNISFTCYDLLDRSSSNPPESIYGDFDIIFCSNLLFYYSPSQREYILHKLRNALSDTGYLITDSAVKSGHMKECCPQAHIFQNRLSQ